MAEILAGLDEELSEYEDGGEFACGEHTGYPMAALLAQVACIVRQDGWCSRKEAKDAWGAKCATVDLAVDFFSRKALEYMSAEKIAKYARTEADEQRAAEAISWSQALEPDVANDYLWNIRVVSHREFIGYGTPGIRL